MAAIIFDPEQAKYTDKVEIYIRNKTNGNLELYQSQESTPDLNVKQSIQSGVDLILTVYQTDFVQKMYLASDIVMTHFEEDSHNVIRVVYFHPDEIEITKKGIRQASTTYGLLVIPSHLGVVMNILK